MQGVTILALDKSAELAHALGHAKKAEELMAKRIPVLISNHRTPLTLDWYKNATDTHTVKVRRSISRNGGTRKKVEELLALYRPAEAGSRPVAVLV